jgi:SAM-dependent methyltransferase
MKIKQLLYGFFTFVPGVSKLREKPTGGTISARYCYSVWIRHLVMTNNNNLNTNFKVVAELGPGDSLGIGIASILTGSDFYYAFDIIKYANIENNLLVFDELVELFKKKTDIPGEQEFPRVFPKLDNYEFPTKLLNNQRMAQALDEERLEKIRRCIANPDSSTMIKYFVPWNRKSSIKEGSVDLIFSQAVLEHVDDLDSVYKAMNKWLKPDGFMSHQIDFKCHGFASEWNGHYLYSKFIWGIIKGKRPYLINRQPLQVHLDLLEKTGFKVCYLNRVKESSSIAKKSLPSLYVNISEEDLTTSGCYYLAKNI